MGRPRTKASKQPRFLAVDFFCGAGGTTRGLIDAGGYVIAGIDKASGCGLTFTDNNPNETLDYSCPRFLEYDIFPASTEFPNGQKTALTGELDRWIPFYRQKAASVPLLFAICAPCQPFTTLSKKGLSEERRQGRQRDSNLLREAASFVARYKPELVLAENVAGIKDPRYGGVWDEFRKCLEDLGYATGTRVVCTSKFGVPQFRKRSILIAVPRGLVRPERFADLICTELLVPQHDPDATVVTAKEAIDHFPPIRAGETHKTVPNHRARTLSELNLRRIACARPGESNAYMEKTEFGDLTLACHRKVNAKLAVRCFTDVYTRMHPARPSPTMTTKCHSISNGRFGHYDTNQHRGISLREAAALQSFPDDYVFYPTDMIEPVARMVGNAVPPKLARFFASYLANSI